MIKKKAASRIRLLTIRVLSFELRLRSATFHVTGTTFHAAEDNYCI